MKYEFTSGNDEYATGNGRIFPLVERSEGLEWIYEQPPHKDPLMKSVEQACKNLVRRETYLECEERTGFKGNHLP